VNRGGGIIAITTTMMLTEREKAEAAAEVQALILASGQTARLLRAQTGERLFGKDEVPFVEVCSFPLELVRTPPEDISRSIDAATSVLPDLDVHAEDRIEMGGTPYRIQTVEEQRLFGVLTHKTLKLVLLHGR
jgi:hypothetical protein